MFDIPDGRATQLYVMEFERRMRRIERVFYPAIRKVYSDQLTMAAKLVEQGLVNDADRVAVEELSERLKQVFILNYRRIGDMFSTWALDEFEKVKSIDIKAPRDEFERNFDIYIATHAAEQIVIVNASQKKLIRRMIKAGMKEGLSHKEIAKNLLTKKVLVSRFKARRIARTETHSVANHSVHMQVKATGRVRLKQWSHSQDDRVRSKKFNHRISEIVKMDEDFEGTGEPLSYPGDPGGSGGNVINCRCVEKYLTR